jgi:uncharacterized protein YjbI with pentapeptide repeats
MADLVETDFTGAILLGSNLVETNLRSAILIRANLFRANLTDANLNANLNRVKLVDANLSEARMSPAEMREAELVNADLSEAFLSRAQLAGADMRRARLTWSNLAEANLSGADLSQAILRGTNLSRTNLSNANLSWAFLTGTNFTGADLSDANLSYSRLDSVTFSDNDLSTAKGLDTIWHIGPSTIGVDTLFKSDGKIPEMFLRDVGIPEDFITFIPSFVGRAIEFYSCFISYSHQDEAFSKRLHSRMRSESLRVWYAPEDMKGGTKLHEEIFRAIQIHDKLLVVLSENSMKSEWVTTEIRRARKVEREENRRKLFPIRLVDFASIEKWECFDVDSGKDLAVELRAFYIPDFTNWKDHDSFEAEFEKLLRALKSTESLS